LKLPMYGLGRNMSYLLFSLLIHEAVSTVGNILARPGCLAIYLITRGLVRYTHFLRKVDHADELGCLHKVECSLARRFFNFGAA
jgi:hypothetical protein